MSVVADPLQKQAGESILFAVDFSDLLDTNETISSATVVEDTDFGGLTIASPTVLAATTTVKGVAIATGKGITVRVSGGNPDTPYVLQVSATTSASNIRQVDCPLSVVK